MSKLFHPLPLLRRRAFTLIELLVVVIIILIIVTASIPAIRSLTKSNNQKQAVNMIASMAAQARSMAIQTHTPCGIVIYDDLMFVAAGGIGNMDTQQQTISHNKEQSYVQLIISVPSSYATIASPINSTQGNMSFDRIPNTGGQPLPAGIVVAMLDDSSAILARLSNQISSQTAAASNRPRIILFDGNGNLVLRDKLANSKYGGSGNGSDVEAASWYFTNGVANVTGVSSPGFIVFNGKDLQDARDNGTLPANSDSAIGAWLEQNADVLMFNRYNGSIIR